MREMPRDPRHFPPHSLIEVTDRTIQGRLLMRPSSAFNEIFVGTLGYAQRKYGLELHDYIAKHILHQPPQTCNYAGNKQVGDFLRKIMEKGQTEDWRKILKEATGEDFSTRAMVEYYAPLLKWLEEQNKGRPIGWE